MRRRRRLCVYVFARDPRPRSRPSLSRSVLSRSTTYHWTKRRGKRQQTAARACASSSSFTNFGLNYSVVGRRQCLKIYAVVVVVVLVKQASTTKKIRIQKSSRTRRRRRRRRTHHRKIYVFFFFFFFFFFFSQQRQNRKRRARTGRKVKE